MFSSLDLASPEDMGQLCPYEIADEEKHPEEGSRNEQSRRELLDNFIFEEVELC